MTNKQQVTIADCEQAYENALKAIESIGFSDSQLMKISEDLTDFQDSANQLLNSLKKAHSHSQSIGSIPANPAEPDKLDVAMDKFHQAMEALSREAERVKQSSLNEETKAYNMGSVLIIAANGMDVIAADSFSTAPTTPLLQGRNK